MDSLAMYTVPKSVLGTIFFGRMALHYLRYILVPGYSVRNIFQLLLKSVQPGPIWVLLIKI